LNRPAQRPVGKPRHRKADARRIVSWSKPRGSFLRAESSGEQVMKGVACSCCFWRVHLLRGRMTTRSHCRNWFKARNNGRRKISTRTFSTRFRSDERAVRQFFRDVQQRFKRLRGGYGGAAANGPTVLPLLESREETRPYAAWLKAQMDYLDVADEIRLTIPPPKVETNQPPNRFPIPAAKGTRALAKKVSGGPGRLQPRICAGVEADFRRPKGAAGTGLGGGSGIVI